MAGRGARSGLHGRSRPWIATLATLGVAVSAASWAADADTTVAMGTPKPGEPLTLTRLDEDTVELRRLEATRVDVWSSLDPVLDRADLRLQRGAKARESGTGFAGFHSKQRRAVLGNHHRIHHQRKREPHRLRRLV